VELYERDKRDTGLYAWWVGVPPRIDNRERREAVFVDGLVSLDGIPVGVEGRGEATEWEGREVIVSRETQRRINMFSKYHIFSAAYLMLMLFIGVVWQFLPGVL